MQYKQVVGGIPPVPFQTVPYI